MWSKVEGGRKVSWGRVAPTPSHCSTDFLHILHLYLCLCIFVFVCLSFLYLYVYLFCISSFQKFIFLCFDNIWQTSAAKGSNLQICYATCATEQRHLSVCSRVLCALTHTHPNPPSLPLLCFILNCAVPIVLHTFVRPFPKHAVSQSSALSRPAFRDFHPSNLSQKVVESG